jgi:hypothetical protein
MFTATAPAGLVHVPLEVNTCTSHGVAPVFGVKVIEPEPFVMVMFVPAVSVVLANVLPVLFPIRICPSV